MGAERNLRLNEGCRWLPTGRRHGAQVILDGHAGQAGEHVPHVGERVDAAALARYDDRVDDGGAVAGVWVADEEEVLFPMADGLMAFSIRLLSSRVQPCSKWATKVSHLLIRYLHAFPSGDFGLERRASRTAAFLRSRSVSSKSRWRSRARSPGPTLRASRKHQRQLRTNQLRANIAAQFLQRIAQLRERGQSLGLNKNPC